MASELGNKICVRGGIHGSFIGVLIDSEVAEKSGVERGRIGRRLRAGT